MNIKFEIEYKDWFDYCPVKGSSPFNTDKHCLCHFKIIEKPNELYLIRKPNFKEDMDPFYKKFFFGKTEKSALPRMVSENNATYLYKISLDYPITADDMVAIGFDKMIIDAPVDNESACEQLMKKVDEYLKKEQAPLRTRKF